MALLDSVSDDFNDNSINVTLWATNYNTGSATFSETGGVAKITCVALTGGTNYSAFRSSAVFDLTGSYGYAELVTPANVASNAVNYFYGAANSMNNVGFLITNGLIYYIKTIAGALTPIVAPAAYSNTTHRWLRYRESAGTVYWDTSLDGVSWTNRASALVATLGVTITSVAAELGGGTYQSEASPGVVEWDNFNTLGGAPPAAVIRNLATLGVG